MPIVILEGPDACGKSTLARRLLKGTGLPTALIQRSGPPGPQEHLRAMIDWIEINSRLPYLNLLLDRHPLISELVYAPLLRNETVPWGESQVVEIFEAVHPLIIYCRPPLSVIRACLNNERQLPGVEDRLPKIARAYDSLMDDLADSGLEVAWHDWTRDSESRLLSTVKEHYEWSDSPTSSNDSPDISVSSAPSSSETAS